MTIPRNLSLSTLALAAALALTACGGGESAPTDAQAFVSRITPAAPVSQRLRALAGTGEGGKTSAAAGTITDDQLVAWAQRQYPEIFGTAAPQRFELDYAGKHFKVWAYANSTYLGVSTEGEAYGLGPFTGNALVSFGAVQSYACTVDPSVCNPPPPTGSLNECIDPTWLSKPAGFQVKLVYGTSGSQSSDWKMDLEIDGPDNFESQSAIKVTTKITTTESVSGFDLTTTTKAESFERAAANGLVESLGAITETTIPGFSIPGFPPQPDTTTKLKTVFNPPYASLQFTLALGQSVTQTHNYTSTVLASSTGIPAVGSVTSGSDTETWTFEAKEPVTVPAGTFNTCRYKETSGGTVTTSWLIVGKGLPVKSEVVEAGQVRTSLLKSGTYGGAPL